jgi:hypothetical protein
MWDSLERSLDQGGVVEYGIFQRNRRRAPIWRRHGRGKRFKTLSNALLNAQGARKACKGEAHYPRTQYSASPDVLIVPYVATWLQNGAYAYLVRAGAENPEITIVPVSEISNLNVSTEEAACVALGEIFARGAATNGIRSLTAQGIRPQ